MQPIQVSLAVDRDIHFRRLDVHASDSDFQIQRIDTLQLDIQPFPAKQRPPATVLQCQLRKMYGPAQGQGRNLPGRLAEDEAQLGVEQAGGKTHGQPWRQIALYNAKVEALEVEGQLALAGVRKRFGTGLRFDPCRIDIGGKNRLDENFRLVGQAGNERQAQCQPTQPMAAPLETIFQAQAPILDADIVEGKAWGGALRLIVGLQPFVEQIGNIVTPVGFADQRQTRPP